MTRRRPLPPGKLRGPLDHPAGGPSRSAWLAVAVVAAAWVALSVSYPLAEADLGQHLAVGRALWTTGSLPRTNVWTWPTAGQPYDIPSWLFRAALWPFYAALGELGLSVWRWLVTGALFAAVLVAARRAQGRASEGLATLFVAVWTALLWRQRATVRPEAFVAPLLVLVIAVLEHRRTRGVKAGALDPAWWLVPIEAVWINCHVSYFLGFAIAAGYLLDELVRRGRGDAGARPAALALAMAAAAAATLLNPFGWRALVQPLDFVLREREGSLMKSIDELRPLDWSRNLRNGLPLYLAAVVALAVRRARARGLDVAQAVTLVVLWSQAFAADRFIGFAAVATAATLARDAEEFLATRSSWFSRPGWARALSAIAAMSLLGALELTRVRPALGLGVRHDFAPEAACDYIERAGVRGRAYNLFSHGGYLLWRFWPDSTRRPFMDAHATGTVADREAQYASQFDPAAWAALDRRDRYDWVLLPGSPTSGQRLNEFLENDAATWALVFTDDAGALYLRRDGRDSALAARDRFTRLGASHAAFAALGPRAMSDSAFRAALRPELDRAVASSRWNARAHTLRASVAIADGRWTDAIADLDSALAMNADLEKAHEWLAYALVRAGQPRRALAEIEIARRAGMSPEAAAWLARQAGGAQGASPDYP